MNHASGSPCVETLNEIVRRIVVAVQPLRVVLFGSAAIGRMGPDSDLDLLVVMPDGVHRRKTAQKIYRSLSGIGVAKDIIVVTESDIHNHGDNPSLIIYPALREGRELYHAAAK
ncbi:MAG: nucleotidyltransferase domain-containing protein [bacterium]